MADDLTPSQAKSRHWSVAIVRASRRLSAGAKLVYELIAELDRSERGCFLSQSMMAEQLGLNTDHLGDIRLHLEAVGLLERQKHEGRRRRGQSAYHWFTRLPPGIPSAPPNGASIEDRRRWVREAADRLDEIIGRRQHDNRRSSPIEEARERSRHGRISRLDIGEFHLPKGSNIGEFSGEQGGNSPTRSAESPAVAEEPKTACAQSVTLTTVGTNECHTAADAANNHKGASPQAGSETNPTPLDPAADVLRRAEQTGDPAVMRAATRWIERQREIGAV